MKKEWDAKTYSKDFQFVYKYGAAALDLLKVGKGDRVLDLGCGNGAITQKIAALGAEAIGLDASAEMLEIAESRYPALKFIQAEATDFSLPEPVDAVFSNAVFHWIRAQDSLLDCVARALRPNGQLVCEFGGKGNNELIHSQLEKAFARRKLNYPRVFFFPTIGEYASLLEAHGFTVVYAALFDRPTDLAGGEEGLENWIKMFLTQPFAGLPSRLADEIIAETAANLKANLYKGEHWQADYVRIRVKALKAA
jgi:trans-aconitate methyltransferase